MVLPFREAQTGTWRTEGLTEGVFLAYFAISENQRVQAQLDRLGVLSLPQGRLGLDTMRDICARLGDPQRRLPPVFHVAGTNGKGSTCAYLRAPFSKRRASSVHTATEPHLVALRRTHPRCRALDQR